MKTMKDGFTAIETARQQFLDGQTITNANDVGIAVIGDLNLRDYFLGLPSEMSLDNCRQFVEALIPLMDEQYLHAFYTVLGAYYYEMGDKDVAYLSLVTAQSLRPDYPLLGLLIRVFEAGWKPEAFAVMRSDLHVKVMDVINNNGERLLEV